MRGEMRAGAQLMLRVKLNRQRAGTEVGISPGVFHILTASAEVTRKIALKRFMAVYLAKQSTMKAGDAQRSCVGRKLRVQKLISKDEQFGSEALFPIRVSPV